MLSHDDKIAVYMEGAFAEKTGKMGLGVLRFSPHQIVCLVDSQNAGADSVALTGIERRVPVVATVEEARALGCNVLLLGIAPPGGLIPESWFPVLDRAVELGFSIVNGLHDRLAPRYPLLHVGGRASPRADTGGPASTQADTGERVSPQAEMETGGRASPRAGAQGDPPSAPGSLEGSTVPPTVPPPASEEGLKVPPPPALGRGRGQGGGGSSPEPPNSRTSEPPNQFIWDIRTEPPGIGVGYAEARHLSNNRVLFIGTDMSVGKMTAGLVMWKEALARGIKAEFVATGQIGITITGKGVPLDCIRLDFACGAIEREVMACKDAELVLVEGQGSLLHPGSTSTLPLIRGSQPTHLVLCHRAGMTTLPRLPWVTVPPLNDFVKLYQDLAEVCGMYRRPEVLGICLNCGHLASDEEARAACEQIERDTGLPTTDPVRFGTEKLLQRL